MEELLDAFKERMHITHGMEDANLLRILKGSHRALTSMCGDFDPLENEWGRELVFERSRYVYNDSVEFFQDNFISDLHGFSLSLLPMEPVAEDATTVVEPDLSGFVIAEEAVNDGEV